MTAQDHYPRKVILVTGISAGIGRCMAVELIQQGHIVYGISRRLSAMKDLAEMGIHTRQADVTRENELTAVVDEILRNHGRIDVLVNNAGASLYGAIEETSISDAQALIDLNVMGYVRAARLVLPHMRKARSGMIINIGSLASTVVIPTNAWYCATKAALESLNDALRLEVRHLGIKVILVEPGIMKTDFGNSALQRSGQLTKIDEYAHFTSHWKTIVTSEIAKGMDPLIIARKVAGIVASGRPRHKYYIPGYMFIIPPLYKLIPGRLVDRISLFILQYKSKQHAPK